MWAELIPVAISWAVISALDWWLIGALMRVLPKFGDGGDQ